MGGDRSHDAEWPRSLWTRWRIRERTRRGRAVRRAEHAPYAIAFAEHELRQPAWIAAALVYLALVCIVAAAFFDWGWLVAVSSGPLGAGISLLRAPKRLERSIDENLRLRSREARMTAR